ncbi:MAG TPA: ABC transporter ATP-binding protein [Candidatus Dormibacteraeota bacterium]|jgi:ABC-2 type transport system ATP-binding protein|nr:ABC transporter ATP-binding protein [Candidatus Dormibacteraeota bacterium]
MAGVALEVTDLVKRYGPRAALDGVSLSAGLGAVTAILGPNGAGKTTLVEICEGFRRQDTGQVRVLGLDPGREGRRLRPLIGVMLQQGGIYPAARPREMLELVAAYYANPLDPAALLRRLGLLEVAGVPCRRLSGGQRQRLSLALAIVGRPAMVFLDEPTTGLDPQARQAAWELISELRRDGVTVILTTHYLEEAERLADRVVIIDRGRVVAQGAPAELTEAGARRRLEFRARPGLDLAGLAAALPSGHVAREVSPGHYVVEGEIGPRVVAEVATWCADRGVLPGDLRIESRSLEDVFLELTGRELRS